MLGPIPTGHVTKRVDVRPAPVRRRKPLLSTRNPSPPTPAIPAAPAASTTCAERIEEIVLVVSGAYFSPLDVGALAGTSRRSGGESAVGSAVPVGATPGRPPLLLKPSRGTCVIEGRVGDLDHGPVGAGLALAGTAPAVAAAATTAVTADDTTATLTLAAVPASRALALAPAVTLALAPLRALAPPPALPIAAAADAIATATAVIVPSHLAIALASHTSHSAPTALIAARHRRCGRRNNLVVPGRHLGFGPDGVRCRPGFKVGRGRGPRLRLLGGRGSGLRSQGLWGRLRGLGEPRRGRGRAGVARRGEALRRVAGEQGGRGPVGGRASLGGVGRARRGGAVRRGSAGEDWVAGVAGGRRTRRIDRRVGAATERGRPARPGRGGSGAGRLRAGRGPAALRTGRRGRGRLSRRRRPRRAPVPILSPHHLQVLDIVPLERDSIEHRARGGHGTSAGGMPPVFSAEHPHSDEDDGRVVRVDVDESAFISWGGGEMESGRGSSRGGAGGN